ncbi:MAG: OsmC family protein [FCB group bacterium]|nr:OsmC family protein [FCB group bacterium]
MKAQATQTLNGIDRAQMQETVKAIKKQPTLAQFEWRVHNKWLGGGANRSTIRDFYGAGQEDTSRSEDFVFVNGEPPVLLGANEGANPVEFLLHALAGCITSTAVIHAAARGIRIESISTRLEGDMDLRGFLDLDPSITPGYEGIRVVVDIQADCGDEELDELLAFAKDHSPVSQSLCRPVPVTVERTRSLSS